MSEENNSKKPINEHWLGKMRWEVRRLIVRFCDPKERGGRQKLFLHNKEEIEFTKHKPDEIEIFYSLIKDHRNYFPYLIQHLSHESETQSVETDHVTGTIDFQKTWTLKQTGSSKLVCLTYEKNIFTPENIMLGYIIHSINHVATEYLNRRKEWDENNLYNDLVIKLRDLSAYAYFLQKDRFVSKLMNYYYRNFDSYESLLGKISYRMRSGKIRPQYKQLIKFIHTWMKLDKILSEPSSVGVEVANHVDSLSNDRLYEYYIFYNILWALGNMKQKEKPNRKLSEQEFSNGTYTVEYQATKKIEWKKNGTELFRIPDTVIKKDGKIKATFDAKCMKYDTKLEEEERTDDWKGMPDRTIVNQMIIAMDYGKEKTKANIGIVLFADDRTKSTVVIEKGPKKIHFLNMHPANNPANALAKVKNIISVE
jgi:hypothetical protein